MADGYEQRFWEKVDRSGGPDACWPWLGSTNANGYGTFNMHGSPALAHRVAYELASGAVPPGLTLDHLCRNRPCVNRAHLEAVTNRENVLRGTGAPARFARRTHCECGRAFDLLVKNRGRFLVRRCSVCQRARNDAYNAARRAAYVPRHERPA